MAEFDILVTTHIPFHISCAIFVQNVTSYYHGCKFQHYTELLLKFNIFTIFGTLKLNHHIYTLNLTFPSNLVTF